MTTTNMRTTITRTSAIAALLLSTLIIIITSSVKPAAQAFSSGSDGSDGALVIAQNAGTIVFDPTDTARWGKVLDPDGDAVYNFTTITIGSGSSLKLRGDTINRPVFWLATGDIVVNGTLDVSGAAGATTPDLSLRRQVAVPGPGGYAGGAGGDPSCSNSVTGDKRGRPGGRRGWGAMRLQP